MGSNARKFEDKPAVRARVPLMFGIMGPSGGGKTFSALRLATGIQRVTPGDIYFVDTEARRSLHYADKFKFRHVEFSAPFSPLDYLDAIEHCVKKGAATVIVDSMSHEHEGPGGVLEMHERELERMGGGEKNNFRAWAGPKSDRRRMINTILQMPCNFIFCFRAKEKSKPGADKKIEEMGFMPIAGEEFIYEMAVNALLMPGAEGTPTWTAEHRGERMMIKLPEQFRSIMLKSQLTEDVGEKLAKWAQGGSATTATTAQLGTFGERIEWPGREQWKGKPLTDAPLDTLLEYEAAVMLAATTATGNKLTLIQEHHAAINQAIAQKEAL